MGITGLGDLALLPPWCLECVIQCLSAKEIICFSCTSKSIQAVCQSDHIWRSIWLNQHNKEVDFKGTWQATVMFLENLPENVVLKASQKNANQYPASTALHHERLWYRCHYQPNMDCPEIPRHLQVQICEAGDDVMPGNDLMPKVWKGLMKDWTTNQWTSFDYIQILLDCKLKVEKPGAGSAIIPLRNYFLYASQQQDEDPLYIFDGDFANRVPQMARDYRPPKGCPQDLFAVLGNRRPDFQWIIMGPVRSGSTWHQDPSGTCAWNALIAGKKRWLFYPPHKIPPGVKVSVDEYGSHHFDAPNPVRWLLEVYPYLSEEDKPYEHIQEAGEIIFLPSQWWHFIINLTDTMAVTENFVREEDLEFAVCDLALGHGISSFHDENAPILDEFAEDNISGINEDCEDPRTLQNSELKQSFVLSSQYSPVSQVRLGDKYADLKLWREQVTKIWGKFGLDPPNVIEFFPVSGGPSVVFKIRDILMKFYCREGQASKLEARAENASLTALNAKFPPHSDFQPFPILIKTSIWDHENFSLTNSEYDLPSMEERIRDELNERLIPDRKDFGRFKWTMMTYSEGVSVDLLNETTEQIAQAIAKPVSMIHNISCQDFIEADNNSQQREEESLQRENLNVLNQPEPNRIKKYSENPTKMPQKQKVVVPFFKTSETWQDDDRELERSQNLGNWGPFLKFLRRRRQDIAQETFSSASLPKHLIQQLDAYLPQDIETLVDESNEPNWLHGDLSSGNILVSGSEDKVNVKLIDFGDSGQGDALYDLIPLHIDVFGTRDYLTESFLKDYNKFRRGQMLDQDKRLQPSYRAMCYTILHDQDLLDIVFERHPKWWSCHSLKDIEENLWGFLNMAF